jgi:tetratricopeptide (TPR) repeat protein
MRQAWSRGLWVLALGGLGWLCGCITTAILDDAIRHGQACKQYIQTGQITEAEARCRLCLDFSPDYWECYNHLGVIAHIRGKPDEAMKFFKEAISKNDRYTDAHNNIGVIFMERGDLSAALDQFEAAIQLQPENLDARANAGQALFKMQRYEEAYHQFLTCNEVDPANTGCRLGMALIAGVKGDHAEAEQQALRCTQGDPSNVDCWSTLCLAFLKQLKCQQAAEACNVALSLRPDAVEARENMGRATSCVVMKSEEIQQCEKDIEKKPDYAPGHLRCGNLYEEHGVLDKALYEYLVASRLDPKLCLSYYRQAKVNDRQLKKQETIDACYQFMDCARKGFQTEQEWCGQRVRELKTQ